MNKVILLGRLGQDPNLNFTNSQKAVCNFLVATSERVKSGDDWVEKTEWHDITTWGKTAENVKEYLTNGSQVLVEGRIQTEVWEDKDGNERKNKKIIADRVHFVGSKNQGGQNGTSDSTPDSTGW